MQHILNKAKRIQSNGFTLVELIIVMAVSGVLMLVVLGPLGALYTSNTQGVKEIIQIGDTRNTLRLVENEIALAISFHKNNTQPDPTGSNGNPLSPTQWAWTGISGDGTSNRVLITSNYATTSNGSSRQLVENATDCTSPLTNNNVYFVKNRTLYRRTITDTTNCTGISMFQKMTCAVGVIDSDCEATDASLINNVENFSVDYFMGDGTQITNQYGAGDIAQAQTVSVTLTVKVGENESSSTLLITRLNGVTS